MSHATGAGSGALAGRITALVLFAFAVLYGIGASQIEYAFSSDPLGPRVFPLALAGVLALLSLLHFLKPGTSEPWPQGRLLALSLTLPALVVAAALLLEPAGFTVAMLVLVTGVGRIFGASWRMAALGGLVQAGIWFLVFGVLLKVYLPTGSLFGL